MSLSPPQQQLLAVIAASQDPDHNTRTEAERQLAHYASSFNGYASLLLSLLQSADLPAHLQTLAAILLKRFIQTHWSEACEPFEAPAVSDEEKNSLRSALLPLLASPQRLVRKQLAAIIAEVAEFDFPERWTSLLPDIINVLQQAQNQPQATDSAAGSNLLTGSMEVLVSFCEEMTDAQMTSAVPHLFPSLLALCQSKFALIHQTQTAAAAAPVNTVEMSDAQKGALDDAVQFCVYALQVYQSCCSSLLTINEVANNDARDSRQATKGKKGAASVAAPMDVVLAQFLQPTLQQWLSFLASILTLPAAATPLQRLNLSVACPMLWALRLEACKTALCVVEKFEDHFLAQGAPGAQALAALVERTLEAAVAVWPLYQRKVLNAKSESAEDDGAEAEAAEEDADEESAEEDAFDEAGNAVNMSSFLFEAFMLLRALLQMRAPKKAPAKKAAGAAGKKGKAAPAAAAAVDPKQEAWSLLKALFSGPALERILHVSVQYLQLSSAEIDASLGHIDDFLAFQQLDSEDGPAFAAQKVNVRNGAKELLLDCMLFGGEDDGHDEEAAQLALMGIDLREAGMSPGASGLLDRELVIRTLCPLITSLLQQSSSLRAQQPRPNKHWWKPREVATMLVSYIVHDITLLSQAPKAGKKGAPAKAAPVQFDLQSFIRDILIPDLSPAPAAGASASSTPPVHVLLRTQALHATRHFAPVFEKANEGGLVLLALEALMGNMAPAANADLLVRISAVHAFGELCAALNNKALLTANDTLVRALHSICQLVHSAATAPSAAAVAAAAVAEGADKKAAIAVAEEVDESALLKVLETLLMAIAVDEKTTISAEPTLTPLLLSAWSANATKPTISGSIVDILENLLSLSPACCTSIQVRVLPALVHIFQANQNNVAVSGTVQAALDLLQHVLLSVEKHTRAAAPASASAAGPASPSAPSAAPELLHPLLFSELLPLTLALLLHTDDRSLIEVGTTVLTAFLRVDSARVAAAQVSVVLPGSAPGTPAAPLGGLQLLCIIINQFLNPALDDKVAHNVGNLIVQLVFSLGPALGENNVKELMKAVVARLHSSTYPPLTESLLMIFARLIHSSGAESILGFLASMGSIAVLEKKQVAVKKNPSDKYTSILRTELVPGSVEALPYLLGRWVSAQGEVHAAYPSKVLHMALAKLLSFLFGSGAGGAGGGADSARAALRNMECRGYVVETKGASGGKRVTRAQTASTGKSHEPAYTKIPLSTKLVTVLLNEWREWSEQEAARAKKQAKKLAKIAKAQAGGGGGGGSDDDEYDSEDDYDEDDDDDFDDEDDFSEDDDDFIAKIIQQEKNAKARGGAGGGAGASPFAAAEDFPDFGASKKGGGGGSSGGKQYMTLSDMLDGDDAAELDEELEEEVYPEALTDPLNQVQLGPFIAGFFKEFAAVAQGQAIKEAAQWLSPSDQKLLEAALAAPAAPAQSTPKK